MPHNCLTLFAALLAVAAPTLAVPVSARSTIEYIIIGGGPAGFVLAEQLSRNSNNIVTLFEAGPTGADETLLEVPAYFAEPLYPYLWNYSSQPDPNLGGSTPSLVQGRVYGGGSAVNAMAYCRGASSVFDEWASISGNQGLAWNNLLSDFKATAHYTYQPANYSEVVNTSNYGSGPLEVSRPSGLTGFDLPFVNALGSQLNLTQQDLTDGTGIGADIGLETIRVSNRTRSYAPNTFGYLMANRPNVKILANSYVIHIGFSGITARNVTYINTNTNQTSTLGADEIIVSGGAINTPKLLMLSGVGPAKTLSSLGIPVVANISAIGTNLYDHHYSVVEVEVTPNVYDMWQLTENTTEMAIAKSEYAKNASGPLGWSNGGGFGCARLPNSVFTAINNTYYPSLPSDRPQVLYQFSAVAGLPSSPNVSIVSTWATLVQPEASGHVVINSSDYRDPPLIFSNYYGSDGDKAAIMYSYKQLRALLQSSDISPVIVREVYPGPDVTTDAQIWKAIQQAAESFHHPIGTVALGTVLDSNWRIKGLNNIRVVDSSTFPFPTTCHPQADVYAVAHRAALDIIQADSQYS